jgi:hypothetical protein
MLVHPSRKQASHCLTSELGSLSDLCNLDNDAFRFHHIVVDRVGRAHCVCRAPHFDPSFQTKEGHWLLGKVSETTDYISFPGERSFYDDYYAMSKGTRTSKYHNTSSVWVTEETDKEQSNAALAGEL